jgi:hypothetical protein
MGLVSYEVKVACAPIGCILCLLRGAAKEWGKVRRPNQIPTQIEIDDTANGLGSETLHIVVELT